MLSPRYWTFLVIVLAAIIYSVIRMSHATQPVSSPADPYSYRYLQLENGLRVLLVQTPGADKASAAMSVGVGAMDDPEFEAFSLQALQSIGWSSAEKPSS